MWEFPDAFAPVPPHVYEFRVSIGIPVSYYFLWQ